MSEHCWQACTDESWLDSNLPQGYEAQNRSEIVSMTGHWSLGVEVYSTTQ